VVSSARWWSTWGLWCCPSSRTHLPVPRCSPEPLSQIKHEHG
jgi:hypothetical protein